MPEPLSKVIILYKQEHEDIAKSINIYFIQEEIPSFFINLSLDVLLKSDNEDSALKDIETSNLAIPILFPIQEANREYSGTRHFYEKIGNLENSGDLLVFPVYVPNDELNNYDENAQYIRKPRTFFKNGASYLWNSSLSTEENFQVFKMRLNDFLKKKEEEKVKIEQNKLYVKKSTDAFTNPTINELILRENNLKWIAYISMIVGFGIIITAIIFLFLSLTQVNISEQDLPKIILISVKNLFLITLFIVAARYAFTFSKTFMNEALKNSDRVHAIRFGELYMKVFEDEIRFEEFKEVFQNWNHKGDGYFLSLKSEDFDSETIDKMIRVFEQIKAMK